MAVVVEEKYKGRKRDAVSAEITYLVFGTDGDAGSTSDEDAYDAVAGVSGIEEYDGIPIQNINVVAELIQDTVWEVAVTYGIDGPPSAFDVGSIQYEFGFQAPVARVYYSLQTIGIYHAGGTWAATKFGGKIRGQGEDEEGIDLPNPSPTNSWIYNVPNGDVSLAYQQAVESVMGHVNSTAFKGRAAGTMRFVGCSGGAQRSAAGGTTKWNVRFDFQFSANRTNVSIGGITIPFIGGHHLLWDVPDTVSDVDLDTTIRKPKCIVVERVFHESNLNALGF